MPAAATMIKICTMGSTTDCISSRPNTFPIAIREFSIFCARAAWVVHSNFINFLLNFRGTLYHKFKKGEVVIDGRPKIFFRGSIVSRKKNNTKDAAEKCGEGKKEQMV